MKVLLSCHIISLKVRTYHAILHAKSELKERLGTQYFDLNNRRTGHNGELDGSLIFGIAYIALAGRKRQSNETHPINGNKLITNV